MAAGLFDKERLDDGDRKALMLGEPLDPGQDVGAIVCSCFTVGRKQIEAAIRDGADSVEAIGRSLKAGTNCGSCKPELGKLLLAANAALPAREANSLAAVQADDFRGRSTCAIRLKVSRLAPRNTPSSAFSAAVARRGTALAERHCAQEGRAGEAMRESPCRHGTSVRPRAHDDPRWRGEYIC